MTLVVWLLYVVVPIRKHTTYTKTSFLIVHSTIMQMYRRLPRTGVQLKFY